MIREIIATAAFATVAVSAGPLAARDRPSGEDQLSKMLEGRVAGEPTSCINTFTNVNSQVIDGTAVVYGRGKTIWVNRTADPESLDRWDAMLVRKWGSQLCRTDIVTTFDTSSGMYTGNVFLTDFVPYTRVD